ncbi:hypothetical protein DRO48_02185 [Candidatus Bathyarchaeota archaeon]|nr:MAG: hypothetical protein DRO48_02185 [Candidatus Bathyarchaeota archaeon]
MPIHLFVKLLVMASSPERVAGATGPLTELSVLKTELYTTAHMLSDTKPQVLSPSNQKAGVWVAVLCASKSTPNFHPPLHVSKARRSPTHSQPNPKNNPERAVPRPHRDENTHKDLNIVYLKTVQLLKPLLGRSLKRVSL